MDKSLGSLFRAVQILLFSTFVACSSASKKNTQTENYGPEAPAVTVSQINPSPTPSESFGPEAPPAPEALFGPGVQNKKKIQVAFTPGFARGFAAAGVLEAIEAAGVEIESVSGVEISALVAGLYGSAQTSNEFEWFIQKLKPEDFISDGVLNGLFGRKKPTQEKLIQKLKQIFKNKKTLSGARVRLNICGKSDGDLLSSLVEATAHPALFDGTTECKSKLGFGTESNSSVKTVWVDFYSAAPLSKKDGELDRSLRAQEKQFRPMIEKAELVLRPNLEEFDLLDFDKKTEIIFKGKEAVEQNLEKIQELVK